MRGGGRTYTTKINTNKKYIYIIVLEVYNIMMTKKADNNIIVYYSIIYC